jgi:hypothetical protein
MRLLRLPLLPLLPLIRLLLLAQSAGCVLSATNPATKLLSVTTSSTASNQSSINPALPGMHL